MSASADPLPGLLRRAAKARASDLSFEPDARGDLQAVARIEGVRTTIATIPATTAAATVARLKGLARLPGYITDVPQDGRIDGAPYDIPGDIRLATLPTANGERVSLRLPAIGPLPSPAALGFPDEAAVHLQAAARRSDGLVLVAGPTGSGKTTTLHSLIADLIASRPDRHVLTIEDPVERRIPGATQVEVASHRGLGFVEALTAALRHDPDVLVVGEIRDPPTALACVRAALTGHLVLSSVHAARAADVVPRILEMGVEPALLLPALTLVAAQRLVRSRHAACRGEGCSGCLDGWSGRRAIIDLMVVDAEQRERLRLRQRPVLAVDLDAQAARFVAQGVSTQAEVERVLG